MSNNSGFEICSFYVSYDVILPLEEKDCLNWLFSAQEQEFLLCEGALRVCF